MKARNLVQALLVSLVLVFTASAEPVSAQAAGSGATQVNAFANFQYSKDTDNSGFLGGSLTRFFTDQLELGVTTLLFLNGGDIGGALAGLVQLNLANQSLWLPYVGVTGGKFWIGGSSLEGLSGEFRLGIRRFVSENVSFNVETSQEYRLNDGFTWSEFKQIPVTFGISVFFPN